MSADREYALLAQELRGVDDDELHVRQREMKELIRHHSYEIAKLEICSSFVLDEIQRRRREATKP